MADLYKANPTQFGGFSTPFPGGSSSRGYYEKPLNVPWITGRSILATIPEYQRNPLLFEKDMMLTVIQEGRANLMRIILEDLERGAGFTVKDVRFRLPIEIVPQDKIYLDVQTVSVNNKGVSKIKIRGNQSKIATAHPDGNIKQVGDIARLEPGQFIILMFSWVEPRRKSAVSGSSTVYYNPVGTANAPMPELCKVLEVDYENSIIKVQRQWAGEQRDSFTYNSTTVPNFEVVSDSTTATWGTANVKVPQRFAFLLPLAKAMKEDEIEAKVRTYSGTWAYGILQRNLTAFGSRHFVETISKNLGLPSPMTKSREQAIKDYYDTWEYTALFGEKSETFDPQTGEWSGTTDGVLANIPRSHYIAIKGIDFNSSFTSGNFQNFGSFNPWVFNKVLEGKAYHGSSTKTLVCGSAFYTSFSTMINFMTQNIPDIRSDWEVKGKSFVTSGGLTVNVIVSDKMTLYGMSNMAILYDREYFKPISLEGYPGFDIVEVNNENPLFTNGFVHGVKGFIDLNPDAHWVFTVVEKRLPDGTDNTSAYNAVDPLGTPLEQ